MKGNYWWDLANSLNPIVSIVGMLLPFLIMIGVAMAIEFHHWYWMLAFPGIFIGLGFIVSLFIWVFRDTAFLGHLSNLERVVDRYIDNIGKEWDREYDQEQRILLGCSFGRTIKGLRDLPAKKRSIRLRFLQTKSLICKPFAK